MRMEPHAYFSVSESKINPPLEANERCFPARHVLRSFPTKGIETVREIVSYIRVSTEGQHKSGLGEDAQRRALTEFAAQHELQDRRRLLRHGERRRAVDQAPGTGRRHPRRPQAQVPGGRRQARSADRATSTSSAA